MRNRRTHVRRAHVVTVGLVVSVMAALLQPVPANAHGGTCDQVDSTPLDAVAPGDILSWTTFNDGDNNGVPNNFLASDDFSPHCGRSVTSEIASQRIYDESSNSNCCLAGDLSIYKLHRASAGQSYVAGATLDLENYGGDFRGIVKISAFGTSPSSCLQVNGSCWERISKLCVSSAYAACDGYDGSSNKILAVSATLPDGTNYVKFNFRARAAQTDAYGSAKFDRVWYCRGC